jgi:hypothetical protein
MRDLTTMARYLVWAMESTARPMSTTEIYRAVQDVCAKYGRVLPPQWEAEIRQTLQAHCGTRPQYKGKDDLFDYHGPGRWSCKERSPSLEQL